MVASSVQREISERVKRLDAEQQRQVLNFILNLTEPQGVSGASLRRFAGTIEPEDLAAMQEAIEDCERIDPAEW
ncbi:hypothetical protein [Aggregatilinea lenta]|uniref:hypothetical protein n=1 Tax=Aggregatilinea lenta TaxID=913108 RepID=UPI000E5C3F4F|nr:hypothetical protein [Aggregatilinea lenta]